MLLLQIYCFVVVGNRGSSDIDRLRSGNDIFVSVVTQLGVTRPCVGRDPVRFSGRLSRGVSMWRLEVPWLDHLLEIQTSIRTLYGFSCRTYHSIMVAPHCLDGSYSRHKCGMPMLAKIYIFIFEMIFFLHYALVIISNVLFNTYQASLTIIRRKLF